MYATRLEEESQNHFLKNLEHSNYTNLHVYVSKNDFIASKSYTVILSYPAMYASVHK